MPADQIPYARDHDDLSAWARLYEGRYPIPNLFAENLNGPLVHVTGLDLGMSRIDKGSELRTSDGVDQSVSCGRDS